MNKEKPTEKKARSAVTKEKIVKNFLKLMTQRRWDSIRVTDICSVTGITRGTFYQYYDDIYDLMSQIQTHLCDSLREVYKKNAPQKGSLPVSSDSLIKQISDEIPPLFLVWFDFCRENKQAMLSLTNEDYGDPAFIKKVKAIVLPHIDAMMDRDGLPRDQLRYHFQQLFFAMHYHSMVIWLSGDDTIPPSVMAKVLNSVRVGNAYFWYKKDRVEGIGYDDMLPDA